MKKTMLMIALCAVSASAFADIPMSGTKLSTHTYGGKTASAKYNSITGQTIAGSMLRTSYSTYKVERSDDGREQTVCEKTTVRATEKSTYSCTKTTVVSRKGTVPRFIPHRRMG